MRPWPNAPRACLLASTSRSEVTCEARSVMFFCAPSITASRSFSFCRFATVCCVERLHRLADAMGHGVEPFGDGARKLRLPAGDHLAHGVHAACGVGLDAGELRHALLQLLGMHVVARRLRAACARGARQHDRNGAEQRENDAGEGRERFADRDDGAADQEEGFCHRRLVARFELIRTKREQRWFARIASLQVDFASPGTAASASRLTGHAVT